MHLLKQSALSYGLKSPRSLALKTKFILFQHLRSFGEDMLDFFILLVLHPATILSNRTTHDCFSMEAIGDISSHLISVAMALSIEAALRFLYLLMVQNRKGVFEREVLENDRYTLREFLLTRASFLLWVPMVSFFQDLTVSNGVHGVTVVLWLMFQRLG